MKEIVHIILVTFAAALAPSVAAGQGPLHTSYDTHGSNDQILDADGRPVRIAGVNWFGAETTTYAPHGLHLRSYKEMMDQMADLGFNTIRLPFSSQLLDSDSMPKGIDFVKNSDLTGL